MPTMLSRDVLASLPDVYDAHGHGRPLWVQDALALETTTPSVPDASEGLVVDLVRTGTLYLDEIRRRRPYSSHNLGIGWLACLTFLLLNGLVLSCAPAESARMLRQLDSGDLSMLDFSQSLQSVSLESDKSLPRNEA